MAKYLLILESTLDNNLQMYRYFNIFSAFDALTALSFKTALHCIHSYNTMIIIIGYGHSKKDNSMRRITIFLTICMANYINSKSTTLKMKCYDNTRTKIWCPHNESPI